jgi:GrpB-like predicted nucleotidyltransferase (UPF0157 family)
MSVSTHDEAPIEVVAYDARWPLKFAAECRVLQAMLTAWLNGPMVHIGSTSVPGLMAKPVIDIMAPVRSLDASRPAIDVVVAGGYVYFPYKDDVMHWLCKPSPAHRTHHLHLVLYGSAHWLQRLAFRDALLASAKLAAEYLDLKRLLAEKFHDDREAYTQAKGPFIQRVLSEL